MDESVLIKNIKYIIAEAWHNSLDGSLNVDTILPLVAAEVYPHRRNIMWMEPDLQAKFGTIQALIDALKNITRFELYDKESLPVALAQQWVSSLSFSSKKKLALSITLIVAVEEDGYISLKGSEKLYANILAQGYTTTNAQYGNLVIVKEQTNNAMENTKVTDANDTTRSASETPTEKEQDSVACNSMENDCTVSTPIQDFFYRILPPAKYPNGLRTYDYMWQYKLSESQYKELKQLVKPYFAKGDPKKKDLENNILSAYGKENGTLSLVLILFLSEWYKRECLRLDGDGGLKAIDFQKNVSKVLWESSMLPKELLHNNDGNEMRQTAMCLLGGLPLECANKANYRFAKIVNALYEIQDKEEITEDTIYDIVKSFDNNNKVFTSSLKSGSCHAYIEQLANYLQSGDEADLPFAKEDKEIEPFKTFLENLKKGYTDKLRADFIKGTLNVWTTYGANSLSADYSLTIGFSNNNNEIQPSDLGQLGIEVNNETCTLEMTMSVAYVDGTEEELCSCIFKRIGNGCENFVSVGRPTLNAEIDIFRAKEIKIAIQGKPFIKSFPIFTDGLYCELYQTGNPYCWSSSRTGNIKTVLIDINSIIEENGNAAAFDDWGKKSPENDFADDLRSFRWLRQKDCIAYAHINGIQGIIPFKRDEELIVWFKPGNLNKQINLMNDGCIEVFDKDENPVSLPILYGSYIKSQRSGFMNMRVKISSVEEVKTDLKKKDFKVEFCNEEFPSWVEWTDTTKPRQGIVRIRVTSPNSDRKWNNKVLYLPCPPQQLPICRDLQNNCIKFSFDEVYKLNEETQEYDATIDKGVYYEDTSQTKDDTTTFLIPSDNTPVYIDVFRAVKIQELLRNGKSITRNNRDINISIRLQDQYTVRVIDESGVHYHESDEVVYEDYLADPKTLCPPKKHNDINLSIYKDIPQEQIGPNGSFYITCSEIYQKEYRFFQYCDGLVHELNHKFELLPQEQQKAGHSARGRLTISGIKARKSVIFQSLKGCSPNFYYRPLYGRPNCSIFLGLWRVILQDYDVEKDITKVYEIAREHKTYFTVFPHFQTFASEQPRKSATRIADFLFDLLKRRHYMLSNLEITDLTRLAVETNFEWMFIPRSRWINRLRQIENDYNRKKAVECIKKLMDRSPLLKKNGEDYHALKTFKRRIFDTAYFDASKDFEDIFESTNRKSKDYARTVIEILHGKVEKNLTWPSPSEFRELLKHLSDSDTAYDTLLKISRNYKKQNIAI